MNSEFFPHTKWLTSKFYTLREMFHIDEFIDNQAKVLGISEKTELFSVFVRKFAEEELVGLYIDKEEYFQPWSWMHSPDMYVFYPTIYKY